MHARVKRAVDVEDAERNTTIRSTTFLVFLNKSPAITLETFKVIPCTIFSLLHHSFSQKNIRPSTQPEILRIIYIWDQFVGKFHLRLLLNLLLYYKCKLLRIYHLPTIHNQRPTMLNEKIISDLNQIVSKFIASFHIILACVCPRQTLWQKTGICIKTCCCTGVCLLYRCLSVASVRTNQRKPSGCSIFKIFADSVK